MSLSVTITNARLTGMRGLAYFLLLPLLNLFISKYSRVTTARRMKLWCFYQAKTIYKTALQVSSELTPGWHLSILRFKKITLIWILLCKVKH